MRQRERAWKRETAVNRIRDIDTDYSEREGRAFTGTKIPREREREREKERGEREKDRHIQTDRQTDRQRHRESAFTFIVHQSQVSQTVFFFISPTAFHE